MNKRTLALGTVAGVVLLALAGYFLALPAMQVNAYREVAVEKHSQLTDKMNEVAALFDKDMFVKADPEPATVHKEVKAGLKSIKAAKETLAEVEADLTSFRTYPLLEWNEKYTAAAQVAVDEKTFLKDARAYVSEMEKVVTYFGSTVDIYERFLKLSEGVETEAEAAATPEALATVLESAVVKLDGETAKLASVKTPNSLKEEHDYTVASMKELTGMFTKMVTAIRAEDLAQLEQIMADITKLEEDSLKKTDELNAKFVRDSQLRKLGDKVHELGREIELDQASL